jgi:hypothetical protein
MSDALALFILFISAESIVTGALARTICDRLEKIFMDLCRMRLGVGEGIMGSILKEMGAIFSLFVLLVLLCAPALGADTKTAYTRDGINFISRERVDENIKYEYAKPGDYREVQVPLNTIVVNASIIPELTSAQDKQEPEIQEDRPSLPDTTIPSNSRESDTRYPYATLGIGLLLVVGVVIFAAWIINGRIRPRK